MDQQAHIRLRSFWQHGTQDGQAKSEKTLLQPIGRPGESKRRRLPAIRKVLRRVLEASYVSAAVKTGRRPLGQRPQRFADRRILESGLSVSHNRELLVVEENCGIVHWFEEQRKEAWELRKAKYKRDCRAAKRSLWLTAVLGSLPSHCNGCDNTTPRARRLRKAWFFQPVPYHSTRRQ